LRKGLEEKGIPYLEQRHSPANHVNPKKKRVIRVGLSEGWARRKEGCYARAPGKMAFRKQDQ